MGYAQTLGAHLMVKLFRQSLILAVCSLSLGAQAAEYFLVATGLGGEDYYSDAFSDRAGLLAESLDLLDADALYTLEADESSLEAFEAVFADLKNRMRAGDELQIYLIGHGSFDGETYKFNITGPDLAGEQLGKLLDDLPTGPQLVTVMTSASGALQELLPGENRVLITATKSGLERNAPVFSAYWTAGLADAAADANKNELLSAAELYQYSVDRVESHYSEENLLASEHALISDETGANEFTVARVGVLASGQLSEMAESLLSERNQIEGNIQQLMSRRAEIPQSEYFDQLQDLMLDLGRIQQRIDMEVEGSGAP